MPRIRSIKPEFWTSGQVLECSRNARLLFIGLWNFCDDAGRHPLRPKQIKAEVFPADDLTPDDIRGMIDELSENDLVMLYEYENQQFIQVRGWHHQRIDKPQPAKHPDPFQEDSKIVRGTFPPDRSGYDKKGEDKDSGGGKPPSPKTPLPKNFVISDRVKRWAKEKGHGNLEGHFENFVIQAQAKGYKYSDWDAAFMTAIRKNWADIGKGKSSDDRFRGAL